jgi:cysteine desulfurase
MAERTAYFDYNATTPLHPEVAQAMTDAMGVFGNPSSLHQFGRYAKELVSAARATVGGLIGASADEILFVGSGSEANNTVLSSIVCPASGCESGMCGCHKGRPSRIVTTTIEHPCVLETAKCMADRGIEVAFVGVDEHGRVLQDALREALQVRTGLVSVMMANNEIGTLQDIRAMADIAHQHGALFHTDAVQAVGKVPVDVDALGVDFLTLSAHKIYGPKGVGALYVRSGTPFCPLIRGGHQEAGRRAGTENTLGIVGLGKAVELRDREMDAERSRLTLIRERIRRGIEDTIPDVRFNGHPVESLPGTLNVSFEGAEGETILLYLDLEGIAVSTGSACASGSLDPSHVLLAIGTPIECAHGSIRISMGRGTTEQDADYLLEVLPRVINRIRAMSTAYVMH